MRRNASYTTVGHKKDLSQSKVDDKPYHRFIYVNQENNRHENATIFHSPYKNGKKNPQYSNPTFMSSDILYPRQYVEQAKNTPKKGILENRNENRLRQLQNERSMGKSKSQLNLQPQDDVMMRRSRIQPTSQHQIIHNRMRRELEALRKERLQQTNNNDNLGQSKISRRTPVRSRTPTKQEQPVYLESQLENDKLRSEMRQMLQKYMQQAMTLKQKTKEQENRNKKIDKKMMQAEEKRFRLQLTTSKQFQKERAQLLKQLLENQAVPRK